MKIVITDSNFQSDLPEREVLSELDATVLRFHCTKKNEVVDLAGDADALIVQFAPITGSVMDQLEKCKIIVRYGIGVDNIDLNAAKERGIKVCNVPNYYLDEVADHTVALVLSLARKIVLLDKSVRRGEWHVEPIARPLIKPSQAIVGLIGFGRIGERVAKRLQAFQYQIVVYDPYLSETKAQQFNVHKLENLRHLLEQSDFISLHVPLTEETVGMINSETIGMMKSTASIINTSRGTLIRTADLAEAIHQKRISGAALDVFEVEPLPLTHPLRSCENVILTPHAAYFSDESILEVQRQAAAEIVREFTNQPLLSWINR